MPTVLLATVGAVAAHGGAFRDDHHYEGPSSFAGLRWIAEVEHDLTMVGTDDGEEWWTVSGTCSGDDMTDITFDFTSKGGPLLSGKWTTTDDGVSIECAHSLRQALRRCTDRVSPLPAPPQGMMATRGRWCTTRLMVHAMRQVSSLS